MISSFTKYTKEIFKDFSSFYVKKQKKWMTIIYTCSVLILLCAIIMFTLSDVFYGVLYLVVGLFFSLYGVFIKFIVFIGNKKNIDNTDAYVFDENEFTITSHNKDGKLLMTSSIKYDALYDVCLYKNYAYIYVNKMSCFILLEQNFEDKLQFNNLIEKIKSKLPKDNLKTETQLKSENEKSNLKEETNANKETSVEKLVIEEEKNLDEKSEDTLEVKTKTKQVHSAKSTKTKTTTKSSSSSTKTKNSKNSNSSKE